MGCKSPHGRAARPAASRVPRASSLEPEPVSLDLDLDLGSWQLVFGWSLGCSLGLVVGLVLGLDPRIVGLVLFRPPPFPRHQAKRDDTSSV